MLHTMRFPGDPPITPGLDVPCYQHQLSAGSAERLARAVLEEKPRILASTPIPTWGADPNTLTSRFTLYNLFYIDRPEFGALEADVKVAYQEYMQCIGRDLEPAYIRGWANCYGLNSRLVWHNHFEALHGIAGPVWSHISGNVSVQTFGTKTWYLSPFLGGVGHNDFGEGYEYPADVIGVPNRVGETFLFPSWLVHKTEPNLNPDQPRITIAYDIIPESTYLRKQDRQLFKQFV